MQVTRNEFKRVRKSISRLKQEVLQLRKLLKEKQSHDLLLVKAREARKMLKTKTMHTRTGLLFLYTYSDTGNLLFKRKNYKA